MHAAGAPGAVVLGLVGHRAEPADHQPRARALEVADDNGAGRSSGVRILDRYIAGAYAPERRFGDYQVLVRRS